MTRQGEQTEQPSSTDNWPAVKAGCEAALPKAIVTYIQQCRQGPHPDSQLINVLHKVQDHFGYLAIPQLDAVAQLLRVPMAKVSGVATFYHFFRLRPKGQYVISVCMGTACYVKGATQISERLRQELGIDIGQTTPDGLFSLAESRCVGTCGLAPALMVNEDVHGKVRPAQIPGLLESYREKARQAAAEGVSPEASMQPQP
jgi:NADH:ubiquinone oxidoreductase subunit E